MEVSVRQIPSYRLACVKHAGKYADSSAAWDRILGWAGRAGVLGRGALVAIVHDFPSRSDNCRYAAGVVLTGELGPDEPVEVEKTPAGLYAVALVRGPIANLTGTYQTVLEQVLPNRGLLLREGQPFLEFFLNSAKQVAQDELLTELCVPVEQIARPEEEEDSDLPPFGFEDDEPAESFDDEDFEESEEEAEEDAAVEGEDEEEAPAKKGRKPAAKKAAAKSEAKPSGRKKASAKESGGAEATPKRAAKKEPAKKAATKKEPAKKASAKKEPAKKEPAKKEAAKKEPAKKAATKKAAVKKK